MYILYHKLSLVYISIKIIKKINYCIYKFHLITVHRIISIPNNSKINQLVDIVSSKLLGAWRVCATNYMYVGTIRNTKLYANARYKYWNFSYQTTVVNRDVKYVCASRSVESEYSFLHEIKSIEIGYDYKNHSLWCFEFGYIISDYNHNKVYIIGKTKSESVLFKLLVYVCKSSHNFLSLCRMWWRMIGCLFLVLLSLRSRCNFNSQPECETPPLVFQPGSNRKSSYAAEKGCKHYNYSNHARKS